MGSNRAPRPHERQCNYLIVKITVADNNVGNCRDVEISGEVLVIVLLRIRRFFNDRGKDGCLL